MDGTVADLYGVDNWLSDLRMENPRPYRIAEPILDMDTLVPLLKRAQQAGHTITVITWLSKNSTEEFKGLTRSAKKDWLALYGFPFDYFHGVQYGTPKADTIRKYARGTEAVLFDDDPKVRKSWHLGEAYEPNNIIEFLEELLAES